MQVKVFAKTNNALQGLINHYHNTRKFKGVLKKFRVKHSFDVDKKLLIIDFKGLIKSIMRKGGSYQGFKNSAKEDFLKDLQKSMDSVNATPNDYEVVFNEPTK